MFERISNSFALARSSWDVLRQDKQLIVFPIVSGIACLFVMAGFALPFVAQPAWLDFIRNNQNLRQPPPLFYVLAFAYYFCNYFVIIFCNAALISCAMIRFNGGRPTIGDGFGAAMSRLPQILAWALVSATVGVLLKMVENANEKIGSFISALLGTAWTIMTFFVVPVLVVEKTGPIDAVKRSLSILRKTWGEALVGNMGIGFFMFLMSIPGILLVVLGVALLAIGHLALLGGVVIAGAVLYFIALSAVSSALHGIFLGAMYQYAANGEVPDGFERGTLKRAFARKDK